MDLGRKTKRPYEFNLLGRWRTKRRWWLPIIATRSWLYNEWYKLPSNSLVLLRKSQLWLHLKFDIRVRSERMGLKTLLLVVFCYVLDILQLFTRTNCSSAMPIRTFAFSISAVSKIILWRYANHSTPIHRNCKPVQQHYHITCW